MQAGCSANRRKCAWLWHLLHLALRFVWKWASFRLPTASHCQQNKQLTNLLGCSVPKHTRVSHSQVFNRNPTTMFTTISNITSLLPLHKRKQAMTVGPFSVALSTSLFFEFGELQRHPRNFRRCPSHRHAPFWTAGRLNITTTTWSSKSLKTRQWRTRRNN